MVILHQIIPAAQLARLSEHQVDLLNSALEAEILNNAAIKRTVASKLQQIHKGFAGGQAAGGGTTARAGGGKKGGGRKGGKKGGGGGGS